MVFHQKQSGKKVLKKEKQPNLAKKIYLISPKIIDSSFYSDLKKVLKTNKVRFFQLRLKNKKKNYIKRCLQKIKKITLKHNVKLILNDDPILTEQMNLDGCHLGQSDMSIKKAKEICNKKIIGITCHGSIALAKKAIQEKVSYIAIGSFYISKLKPKAKRANLAVLKSIRKKTKIPIVAIGGINNKNYKNILKSGANYIAISTFIWNNPQLNPDEAIKKFI